MNRSHPMPMPLRRAVVALLAAALCGAAAAQTAADATAFDGAMRHYEQNHWPEAYAALAALADRGHAESARIALQMWAHGPRLYGVAFVASARQVELWSQRSGCGGGATDGPCRAVVHAR